MKKDDAEKAIRQLCHEWEKSKGARFTAADHPSFSEFKSWLSDMGYAHYLNFRAVGGPEYVAEMWFDQEFKQTWRN